MQHLRLMTCVAALSVLSGAAMAESPTEFMLNEQKRVESLRYANMAIAVRSVIQGAPRHKRAQRTKVRQPVTRVIAPVSSHQDYVVRDQSPIEFILAETKSVSTTTRESVSIPKTEVARVVDVVSDRFSLPRDLVHEHVRLESGYRVAARNPASTAKGLTQVVRCSHAAIIRRDCRTFSHSEHFARAADAMHNLNVGLAHIAAAREARPHWSARELWRRCHVGGLHNCGTSLDRAAELYARAVGA